MLKLARTLTLGAIRGMASFINKFSMSFDGVQENLQTTADDTAQPTTYSFWCKASETGLNRGLFGHGGSTTGAFHFNWSSDRPALRLGSNYYRYWDDTSAQDDGQWHHWVVYSDTNDITNCKLYVDGVLQTVNTTVSSGSLNAYTESLTIGSARESGGDHFEGQIDEFAVYHKELSQAEIDVLYNTYYGDNIVTNGDFASNITGWSAKDCTIVWDNGKLKTDNSSGNQSGGAFQNIGLVTGKQYKMTATMQLLTGASNGTFNLFTSTSGGTGQSSVYTGSTLVVGGAAVTETFYFTPASGDVSIQFTCDEANATFTIDNIIVEEQKHKATNLLKDSGDYTSSADLENYYRMGDGKLDSYPTIFDQKGSDNATMTNMSSGNILQDTPVTS